jgi:hypothetical protein
MENEKTISKAFASEMAEMAIAGEGGWFEPETVSLLKTALDQAWDSLAEDQRARTSRTDMAKRILKLARKGVRDPVRLRTCALTVIAWPVKAAS